MLRPHGNVEEMHTQCRLVRELGHNERMITVSWIPTKYAVVGRRVELAQGDRRSDQTWSPEWVVDSVGNTYPSKIMLARERDYLKHRKATDI